MTTTAETGWHSVPAAASLARCTLWQLRGALARRPDLAARCGRVAGRVAVPDGLIPELADVVAATRMGRPRKGAGCGAH